MLPSIVIFDMRKWRGHVLSYAANAAAIDVWLDKPTGFCCGVVHGVHGDSVIECEIAFEPVMELLSRPGYAMHSIGLEMFEHVGMSGDKSIDFWSETCRKRACIQTWVKVGYVPGILITVHPSETKGLVFFFTLVQRSDSPNWITDLAECPEAMAVSKEGTEHEQIVIHAGKYSSTDVSGQAP